MEGCFMFQWGGGGGVCPMGGGGEKPNKTKRKEISGGCILQFDFGWYSIHFDIVL